MVKVPAYIFDIDGTLSDCSQRKHFVEQEVKDWDNFYKGMAEDEPNWDVINILNKILLSNFSGKILFVTGRPESYREVTEYWLAKYFRELNAYNCKIFMRKDGDYRSDAVIKKELWETVLEPIYDCYGVFEDRKQVVDMYRELGLTVFQVAEGNF